MLLLCALIVGSSNAWAVSKPWSGNDPSSTLDLQTITSSTMGTWNGNTSWYLDDDYLIVSGYESYRSVANQTWITQSSVGSSTSSWDASTPFKGSSYYTNASYATFQSGRYLLYKVTNLKSLKVYGKNNSTTKYLDIFIYTKSGDDYTKVEEIYDTSGNSNQTWTNSTTLSPANTYFIYITGVGGSNSRVFEIAFERNPANPSSGASFEESTPSISFPAVSTYSQVANTATGYTGTVTYSITANTAGASIEGSTITVTQEGSVTVKATAPAITGWSKSEATYTLTVSDTRSANGLAYSEDEQEVRTGETLDAPTLTNPNNLPVTYESEDNDIATVDESGNVTGVAFGSTTISAVFAGNATYKAGTVSYTINVKKGKPAGALFWEDLTGYEGSTDVSTALTTSNEYLDSKDWNSFTKVYPGKVLSGDTDGHLKFGSSNDPGTAVTKAISLTGSGKLTYKVQRYDSSNPGNLKITVTGAEATGDVDVTGGASWEEKTVYLNEATGSVVITFATTSSKTRIRVDNITLVEITSDPIAIGSTGWSTLVSNYALNFTGTNVKAYTVTGHSGSSITKSDALGIVPAGTPLLLNASEGNYNIPVAASSSSVGSNLLKAGTGAAVSAEAGKTKYVLAAVGEPAVATFLRINATPATVLVGKAYLEFNEEIAGAPALRIVEENQDATGIDDIEANEKAVKFVENGRILIKKNGIVYDALGRIIR